MDYDTPLEYFNGKTAYEVSKEGYSKHLSQQWTWFTDWINGKNDNYTKATDIKTYSPLKYGLFFSNVGEDIQKNDMFENIKYYKVQEVEEEQQSQKEQELLEKHETERAKNKSKKNGTTMYINILICVLIGTGIVFITVKTLRKKK